MGLWRWFVSLFRRDTKVRAVEDDRYHSPEERRRYDIAAANAARAGESGVGAPPPPSI